MSSPSKTASTSTSSPRKYLSTSNGASGTISAARTRRTKPAGLRCTRFPSRDRPARTTDAPAPESPVRARSHAPRGSCVRRALADERRRGAIARRRTARDPRPCRATHGRCRRFGRRERCSSAARLIAVCPPNASITPRALVARYAASTSSAPAVRRSARRRYRSRSKPFRDCCSRRRGERRRPCSAHAACTQL